MACTDTIALENLDFCPSDEVAAGVSEVGVYFSPLDKIETIAGVPALSAATTNKEAATIDTAHTFTGDNGFVKVYINPDTGMVESTQVGEKGNMSFQNSFTGALQGTAAQVAGWIRNNKNRPGIWIIKERNGDVKQIGSELSPAYFSEVTGTSGQAPGDRKATTIKIMDTQPYPAPEYAGTITEFTPAV
ncbi:hypothetical protein MG296_10615 [Flavobacteriaceae bacterium TK19130]|nr:hypothetical protein [Thermobacterium salinum]